MSFEYYVWHAQLPLEVLCEVKRHVPEFTSEQLHFHQNTHTGLLYNPNWKHTVMLHCLVKGFKPFSVEQLKLI